MTLKGTLINVSFDNLGGNGLYGFVESFNARFYCRICSCHKDECQEMTRGKKTNLRTVNQYNQDVEHAKKYDRIDDVDTAKTKGIKKYCILNEIQHFHIVENINVDLMHDLNEGVILLTLHKLFEYCISIKILKKSEIIETVRDFNYGLIDKENGRSPSNLDLESKNLNQNASQLYCIFVNIPFILHKYEISLKNVWSCITDLLQIMQIIYSCRITEKQLLELENHTHSYLRNFKLVFGNKFTPKQHFLLHYSTAIRKMGPVIHNWMMRFEAKHNEFTNMAKRTSNFRNITKTLADRHQQKLLSEGCTYRDTMLE